MGLLETVITIECYEIRGSYFLSTECSTGPHVEEMPSNICNILMRITEVDARAIQIRRHGPHSLEFESYGHTHNTQVQTQTKQMCPNMVKT